MKINFGEVNISFENIDCDDERSKRISQLMLQLLDEKLEAVRETLGGSGNPSFIIYKKTISRSATKTVTLNKIVVPPISVDSEHRDYEIASRCASAIYQTIMARLK